MPWRLQLQLLLRSCSCSRGVGVGVGVTGGVAVGVGDGVGFGTLPEPDFCAHWGAGLKEAYCCVRRLGAWSASNRKL